MFGTSGIRGTVGTDVTAATALAVGRALPSCGYETVVVGRDPRESGRMLTRALAAGVTECGGRVIDLGLAATPTVARSVGWADADAGVSVTASHNPPPDNGLKLWTPSGQAFDDERRGEITDCVERESFDLQPWDAVGAVVHDSVPGERAADGRANDGVRSVSADSTSASERHVAAITETVEKPVASRVVVDVGNGAGGVTARALDELGCHVETLNAQPDGSFPGRPSEPTADTCETLSATVATTDAVLGIAHDGDADRMLAVDETGRFLSGDVLVTIFARRAATAGERVAVPVDTSRAVADTLAEAGVEVTRTRVGDVYVAAAATAPDVAFGGEPSGAWIWPDETLCPDGPLAACTLASVVGGDESLAELADRVPTYPIRRTNLETDEKARVMAAVERAVSDQYDAANVTTLDGVRVETADGWFLIRASGTQPLVRVTAEAPDADDADELLAVAESLVGDAIEG